jgi:ATP-dependent helicase Lhr and Lhr-like helicase
VRQRSLAKLRRAVEPVEPRVLGRLLTSWQGVLHPRPGLDAILDAVERLQGCPLPASVLESDLLPARVANYQPGDLDTLAAAGEVAWVGVETLGARDGRLALYLTDEMPHLLRPPAASRVALSGRELAVLAYLRSAGASFFGPIHESAGGGFPRPTVDALWSLAWKGLITNDTFRALRAFLTPAGARKGRPRPRLAAAYRSRRAAPASAEGRWTLLEARMEEATSATEWSTAVAQQLLARYGLVTRAVAQAEGLPGGFSAVYDVFKALEEAGRIRRGYFVAGVGATQFVLPPVVDLLRSLRQAAEPPEVVTLAATDPANPYGALLPWTEEGAATQVRAARAVGAHVVLVDGALAAWMGRAGRQAWVWLPESEPDRTRVARAVAKQFSALGHAAQADRGGGLVLEELNGQRATEHPLALFLSEVGFVPSSLGFHLRRSRPSLEELFGGKRDN